MSHQANNRQEQPQRATRYAIPMLLQYRQPGEETWHGGRVENISRSGVLFTVEEVVEVSSQVEMIFQLPVEIRGASAGQVCCTGQVVRTVLPASTDRSPALAASIQSYEFSHPDRV
jgi:PilZ domain